MIIDDLILRPAEVGDVSRLWELWLQDVNYHIQFDPIWSLKKGATESFSNFTREAIQKDDALVVVAESNETIIGFIHAQVSYRPPVFAASKHVGIMDLAVEESFRNKGIGSKLIERAEEWCQKIGISRLTMGRRTFSPINRL